MNHTIEWTHNDEDDEGGEDFGLSSFNTPL